MKQIFNIKETFQKMWKYNKEVYTRFVDFKKTYDSIHRPSLFNILKEFNFPKKLIKACLENSEIIIKIASSISQLFKVTTGLR